MRVRGSLPAKPRPRVFLVLLTLLLSACFATGQAAYEKMNEDQRRFATGVLTQFGPSTTVEEISEVLGPPYRTTSGKVYWRRPGAGDSERIDVYFANGGIFKIRYLSADPIWAWDLNAQGGKLVAPE